MTTHIASGFRLVSYPSPLANNATLSYSYCLHCTPLRRGLFVVWLSLVRFGKYLDTPNLCAEIEKCVILGNCIQCIREHSFVISQWHTFKHSDDRALPQQLSPFSCRSKHSNNFCSSLRRHPAFVSCTDIDIAHTLPHSMPTACEQHIRPDHWAPRVIAKMGE